MTQMNPLQKYFRQPKVYISLPSKGLYYETGAFQGDYNQVPIFAMTGMDEIISRTPDALFTGEATIKIIESCCPFIKKAKNMPSIDIEALMIAIRIATFGETMSVSQTCKKCGTENTYDINLQGLIDYFSSLQFAPSIKINDEITVKVRPLQYEEMSFFSIENFKLQKMLFQAADLTEDERQKTIDKIYNDLSDLQLQLFLTSIENVQMPAMVVDNKTFIEEWLRNCDRQIYTLIKKKMEENKEQWSIPKQGVACSNCKHEDNIQLVLDQATFFA